MGRSRRLGGRAAGPPVVRQQWVAGGGHRAPTSSGHSPPGAPGHWQRSAALSDRVTAMPVNLWRRENPWEKALRGLGDAPATLAALPRPLLGRLGRPPALPPR